MTAESARLEETKTTATRAMPGTTFPTIKRARRGEDGIRYAVVRVRSQAAATDTT